MDTSAELGLDVVRLTGRAKCLEVSNAKGLIREPKDEVKGAGDVSAQAIDHQLRANGGDGFPDGVLDHWIDVGAEGFVFIRSRLRRGLPSSRRVPAMIDEVLQSLVSGVAPVFPEVAFGHDLLDLVRGLGDR